MGQGTVPCRTSTGTVLDNSLEVKLWPKARTGGSAGPAYPPIPSAYEGGNVPWVRWEVTGPGLKAPGPTTALVNKQRLTRK